MTIKLKPANTSETSTNHLPTLDFARVGTLHRFLDVGTGQQRFCHPIAAASRLVYLSAALHLLFDAQVSGGLRRFAQVDATQWLDLRRRAHGGLAFARLVARPLRHSLASSTAVGLTGAHASHTGGGGGLHMSTLMRWLAHRARTHADIRFACMRRSAAAETRATSVHLPLAACDAILRGDGLQLHAWPSHLTRRRRPARTCSVGSRIGHRTHTVAHLDPENTGQPPPICGSA
jgi:hypothetical protein